MLYRGVRLGAPSNHPLEEINLLVKRGLKTCMGTKFGRAGKREDADLAMLLPSLRATELV